MINSISSCSVGLVFMLAIPAAGQHHADSNSGNHTQIHDDGQKDSKPPLPEGMTLDQLLDYAKYPPPTDWTKPVHDNALYAFTLIELFEYRFSKNDRDEVGWDAQGWIGNDDHKFWWKTEGEASFDGNEEGVADLQALYAMPISAFWYFQVGVQYQQAWEPGSTDERFAFAIGVQGLAPYKFELEPTLLFTDDGDVIAQLTASYDIYLTQRLVLQPRIELSASLDGISASSQGAGIHGGDFDLRIRYEFSREFAPYMGVRYSQLFGETADIASKAGDADHDLLFILGWRFAF